jgi:hypothetical protein
MTIRFLLRSVFLFLTVAAQATGGGSFADENGCEQIIETTDSHPFWVVSESGSRYVDAKDLREGDVFIGANGELSCLAGKERVEYPAGITVYNFTVDGHHDYFVIAETAEYGQTCVLVHNACAYYAKIDNQIKYIGITDNFRVRAAQHYYKTNGLRDIKKISGLESLTRDQARAIEQALIEKYCLENLDNKINSIASKNYSSDRWKELLPWARKQVENLDL